MLRCGDLVEETGRLEMDTKVLEAQRKIEEAEKALAQSGGKSRGDPPITKRDEK